jgi:hypothetical protein
MNKNLEIAIHKIQELDFYVNDEDIKKREIEFYLKVDTQFNLGEDVIKFDVRPVFHVKNHPEEHVLSNTSRTVFKTKGLREFLDEENKLNIPDQYLITMLSISITHARALLSKSSLGSRFSNLFIPIVNPAAIFKDLVV